MLLLDEVLAGLNPSEIRDMVPVIREIRERGVTIMMIEHVMQAVMSLAEQVFVLARGPHHRRGHARRRSPPIRPWSRPISGTAPRAKLGGAHGVSALLDVSGLHAGYGETEVLRGIDLDGRAGEIVAVLGSNGVGKSTLNRTISGLSCAPRAARSASRAATIDARTAAAIVARGLIHVPEGRRIFPEHDACARISISAATAAPARAARRIASACFRSFHGLRERRAQHAGTLSGGEQQMLAIGRGLMAEPKLLILDEPSLGLSPLLVEELFALIAAHQRAMASRSCWSSRTWCRASKSPTAPISSTEGKFVMSGSAADIAADPALKRAYLGM